MTAYSVDLDVECSETGCTRRATVEVRNSRNEPIRKTCKRHGELLVIYLNGLGLG